MLTRQRRKDSQKKFSGEPQEKELTDAQMGRYLATCTFEMVDAEGTEIPVKARSVTLYPSGRAVVILANGRRATFGTASRTCPGNSKFFRIVEVRPTKVSRL